MQAIPRNCVLCEETSKYRSLQELLVVLLDVGEHMSPYHGFIKKSVFNLVEEKVGRPLAPVTVVTCLYARPVIPNLLP
jgi:hypothetical protein